MDATIIHACWGALTLVWLTAAAFTKPTRLTTDRTIRAGSMATLLTGFFLVAAEWPHGWLAGRPVATTPAAALLGVALTILGCAFAIWARLALGSNWSGRPTLKANHELVITGPYALARHPIYTGILTATLGTALADLQWRRVLGVVMIALALLVKIRQEERLMSEAFPDSYPPYRRRVKALIPGLL